MTMMMNGGATVEAPPLRRVTSLPFQRMKDEILVVDPRTREVHLLNATASRVWDLLAEPRTPDEVVTILGGEFEAAPEVLRADVEALLTEMDRKGLIGNDESQAHRSAAVPARPGGGR